MDQSEARREAKRLNDGAARPGMIAVASTNPPEAWGGSTSEWTVIWVPSSEYTPEPDDESGVWVMPEWMQPYRELITNTGGNQIEELMNDHTANLFSNAPRAMLCVVVKSQVALLTNLHTTGVI